MTKKELVEKAKALGLDTKGLTVTELENAINALTPPAPPVTGGETAPEDETPGETEAGTTPGETPAGETQGGEAVSGQSPEFLSFLSTLQAGGTDSGDDDEEEEEEGPEPEDEDGEDPEQSSEPRTEFEYKGSRYRFKKSAPERFNFLKENKTQQEWLQDDDAMELLIEGRNHLIIKIKE